MKIYQKGMTLLEITVVLLILVALAGLAIPFVSGTSQMAMCRATDATMQAVKEAIMGGGAGTGYYADLLGQYPRDKSAVTGYNLNYLFARDDDTDNDLDLDCSHLTNCNGVFDPEDEWQIYNPKTAVGWRGPYLMSGVTLASSSAFDIVDLQANYANTAYVQDTLINTMSSVLDAWGRPIVLQVSGSIARLVSAGPGQGIGFDKGDIDTLVLDTGRKVDDRILNLQGTTPANIACVDS